MENLKRIIKENMITIIYSISRTVLFFANVLFLVPECTGTIIKICTNQNDKSYIIFTTFFALSIFEPLHPYVCRYYCVVIIVMIFGFLFVFEDIFYLLELIPVVNCIQKQINSKKKGENGDIKTTNKQLHEPSGNSIEKNKDSDNELE